MGQACFGQGNQKTAIQKKTCNKCKKAINNAHIHQCTVVIIAKQGLPQIGALKPILELSKKEVLNNYNYVQTYGSSCHATQNQQINVKIFKSPQRTETRWVKQQAWNFPFTIKQLKPEQTKKLSFQQKLFWLRINLQALRVSWQNGCEQLKVDRANILMSSKQALTKLNLRKQVKINFDDEKVDDAGGLLRQWMHLSIKQIFDHQIGIFKLTDSPELYYKFCWDQNLVQEYVVEMMTVLGMIIGKAIFERNSINCYLDRTILRQICGQPVYFEDMYSYDAKFYRSWKELLQMTDASQLGLDFCIYHSNQNTNEMHVIKLKPNGEKQIVDNSNRHQYVRLMIHHYCSLSCRKYIQILRQNIYKVVPFQFLSVFQPIELEMIITGPKVIDILDWKMHTQYRGYKYSDVQVTWFWNFAQKLNQDMLANLLHYVTGSSKVPILGFKYLQSNRSQVARFTIQKVQYSQNNPYPKSHTCFNRLQLPNYKSQQQMANYLKSITETELTHFGLS